MQKDKKFFSLNKRHDFEKCDMISMFADHNGVKLIENTSKGTCILKPLDSFEKGMVWDRISMRGLVPDGSKIKGFFHATDSEEAYKLILDAHRDPKEKMAFMKTLEVLEIEDPADALLHTLKGRYLIGWLSVFASGDTPVIERIRIHYPYQSLLDYLPEVFRTNDYSDFLHRYLSIYRTLLMELEEEVDLSPLHLLTEHGSEADVNWLAETLGLESPEIWSFEELKNRVSQATRLSGIRGTRPAIEEISSFITGFECFIIEQHDLGRKSADAYLNILYDRLYGKSHADFTILVPEDKLASEQIYNQMKKALDSVKPSFTNARLVSLQPYLRLDQHAYLGINSTINKPGRLVLDNRSSLPYKTVLADCAERKM